MPPEMMVPVLVDAWRDGLMPSAIGRLSASW
jgi:hypothetical protein